jgi:hypothetical protein
MSTSPAPVTCLVPIFDTEIRDLENQVNTEDQNNKKSQLAARRKINDEVEAVLAAYKKDYNRLVFEENESEHYHAQRLASIKLSDEEKKTIKRIVQCTPAIHQLETDWKAARNSLPDLQATVAKAQNEAADAEANYKAALEYLANQRALDDLRTQSTKEFNAQNFRGAFFLLYYEMKQKLVAPMKPPLPPEDPYPCVDPPANFTCNLKKIAESHYQAQEKLRLAKIKLDQATADAQKKKKDFDDAKTKRRENILKQIADEPFPPPPSSPTPGEKPPTPDQDTTGDTGATQTV